MYISFVAGGLAGDGSRASVPWRPCSSWEAKPSCSKTRLDLNCASPLRSARRPAAAASHLLSLGPHQVCVHVYDVDPLAKWTLNRLATGDTDIGAFHCGVEVAGMEYYFTGAPGGLTGPASGVRRHAPRGYNAQLYRESVPLGASPLSTLEILGVLDGLGRQWQAESYNLLSRNCTDFAAQLVVELKPPEPFPAWTHGIAKHLAGLGGALAGARRRPCCCCS